MDHGSDDDVLAVGGTVYGVREVIVKKKNEKQKHTPKRWWLREINLGARLIVFARRSLCRMGFFFFHMRSSCVRVNPLVLSGLVQTAYGAAARISAQALTALQNGFPSAGETHATACLSEYGWCNNPWVFGRSLQTPAFEHRQGKEKRSSCH